jgi:uncharacterized protein (TIGR02246 family)
MILRAVRAGGLPLLAALLVFGLSPGLACRQRENASEDSAPSPADLQAIQRLRDTFASDYNEQNAERLSDLFTEDAVFAPADDATCEGKREIEEFFRDVLDQEPATIELEVRETEVRGDWAFERIDATLTATDSTTGEEYEIWERYFWVLKRQPGGSWRIARALYNIDESEGEDEDTGFQPQT